MEQKSNVQSRAEKEYKNRREKFSLLLREIISNSIHAVLIRKSKEQDYTPEVWLKILFYDDLCQIELKDNGEGFTGREGDRHPCAQIFFQKPHVFLNLSLKSNELYAFMAIVKGYSVKVTLFDSAD